MSAVIQGEFFEYVPKGLTEEIKQIFPPELVR